MSDVLSEDLRARRRRGIGAVPDPLPLCATQRRILPMVSARSANGAPIRILQGLGKNQHCALSSDPMTTRAGSGSHEIEVPRIEPRPAAFSFDFQAFFQHPTSPYSRTDSSSAFEYCRTACEEWSYYPRKLHKKGGSVS